MKIPFSGTVGILKASIMAEWLLPIYLLAIGAGLIVSGIHLQAATIILLNRNFVYGFGNF